MANYIIKTKDIYEKGEDGKKHKVGTEEKKFRVDAAFIPQSIDEICDEFIGNYCEAHEETDWLVEQLEATIVTKKSQKEIALPFVVLRRNFASKFFPSLVKEAKPALSWREKTLAKYKKR